MRSRRARLFLLLLLSLFVAGCGAAPRDGDHRSGQPTTTVRGHGVRVELPAGWHGEVVRPQPPGALTLRAANFPHPPLTDLGRDLQLTMGARDILITLVHYGRLPDDSRIRRATLPLAIDRDDFVSFEGFKRPVATDSFVVEGRAFQLWAVFRDGTPSDKLVAEANRVLATIALEPRRLALGGLSIELPVGWDGFVKYMGHDDEAPAVYAANVPWPDVGQNIQEAGVQELFKRLPRDGVVISAVSSWYSGGEVPPKLTPPIELAEGHFLADMYEGQPAPNVSTQLIFGRIGDRFLNVQVFFGRNDPDKAMRDEANAVLANLTVTGQPAAPAPAGWRKHQAPELGLHATVPADWHLADEPLTVTTDPREVLALASYPLATGGKGGGCVAVTRAVEAMPADGALIWLLEYRPARGDVWADLPRSRFPPRPDDYELTRPDLHRDVCGAALGLSTTFRDADRPFQLWLLFGAEVSDARIADVAQILTALSFDELPAPPPDPYAGWPLLNTNPGDSLHVPPGWTAAAAMFPPGTSRPRPLFFASNRPLFGLPQKLVPHVDALPGPMPSAAVANRFPDDGVLLWVVEESDGWQIGEHFPPIDRNWPRLDDFRPADVLTKPNPQLRWLHAGGEWRGHRFSIWVASGPDASKEDQQLALTSATSLAVSGCGRDSSNDCPSG